MDLILTKGRSKGLTSYVHALLPSYPLSSVFSPVSSLDSGVHFGNRATCGIFDWTVCVRAWTNNRCQLAVSIVNVVSAPRVCPPLQGWAEVRFQGSVNMRRKSCVLLPAAGGRTQIFTLFSQNLGTVLQPIPVRQSPSGLVARPVVPPRHRGHHGSVSRH